MRVKIYNTLNNRKEEFVPVTPGKVGMYVCGPTVYNFIHLGNARPAVVFDTVRRYFEYQGYDVDYILNFTDVDDKIINKAAEEEISPLELAEKYIGEYYRDTGSLNIRKADSNPRVSENIGEIIEFVEGLLEKGHAYETGGDVYFSVKSFPGYGKLSGRSTDDLLSGARVAVNEDKRDALDFALWKKAKEGEISWDSPWGPGRPGWHIECSVMSRNSLGDTFDIHGGGQDLIFPHHENEIAQSEALTGCTMAKYWMHNGFITINKEKMSKSLGNFFLVREILEKYDPMTVRFYLLSTHYRSPLDFDDTKLEAAGKSLERLFNARREMQRYLGNAPESGSGVLAEAAEKAVRAFEAAMDDDFNTALAFAAVFELVRSGNTARAAGTAGRDEAIRFLAVFEELMDVLGIMISEEEAGGDITPFVDLLVQVREKARAGKDFALSDFIRDKLAENGIILEDTREGTVWKNGSK